MLPPEDAIQIDKDINRTLRSHKVFHSRYGEGQCKLFRVLKAYTLYNEETRYTQGMSTITAILLLYLPSEEIAYGALKEMFKRYGLNDWYANGFQGLQDRVFPTFEALVKQKLPRIHDHLDHHLGKTMSVDHYSGLFVTNWFLELFFDSLPWTLMLKVWDTFLWSGVPAIYSLALAVLASLEPVLLAKQDLTQIVKEIKGTGNFMGDPKKLLKRAYKFDITQSTLTNVNVSSN